ncbi:MAG: hypothetical protein K6G12_06835 [Lachnospiraceae bacterium]|nr:hypothetical protein [Lachnospiraceae bacterium]
MINTYEAYLKDAAGDALKIEDALDIYTKMAAGIERCSLEDKEDFWYDVLKAAAHYTNIRNEWEVMDNVQRAAADKGRTVAHNSFIDSLNIISRIMEKEGVDNSWREQLGDARKRIGDFACFITYITGISNR